MKKLLFAALLLFAPLANAQVVPYSDIVLTSRGTPAGGASVAVCGNPGFATTAAQVTSNIAILTFGSSPITAGFVANMSLTVSGFTGADTYFNGSFTILSVTSTTVTYALTHANASASSNGSAFQAGNASTSCAPLSSIFSDSAGLVPITQPGFAATNIGNYSFYAAPNSYNIQLYGQVLTTTIKAIVLPVSTVNGTTSVNNLAVNGTGTFNGQLNCKNLDNISCLDDTNTQGFTGSDLGGWLNSSYTRCLAGTCGIDLFPSSGNATAFSTPVTFSTLDRQVNFICRGTANSNATGGLELNYTPTTSTNAFTIDNIETGGIRWVPSDFRNCTIVNNPASFTNGGSGSSAVGLASGVTNGGMGWINFANDSFLGFGTGIKFASSGPGWGVAFDNSTIGLNNIGIDQPGNQEIVHLTKSRLISNGKGYRQTGFGDVTFLQIQCDSNTTSCYDSSAVVGGGVHTSVGTHYENLGTSNCLYETLGGTILSLFGGSILNDTTTTNCTEQFHLSSSQVYHVVGASVSTAGQTATNVFNVVSPATGYFEVGNMSPSVYTTDASIVGGTATAYEAHICTQSKSCHQYFFNNNSGAQFSSVFGRALTSNGMVTVHYSSGTEHGLCVDNVASAIWCLGPGEGGVPFGLFDISNGVLRFSVDTSNAIGTTNAFKGNTVALTADWTCGTGGTVSSCVAATIIGSGGGVPLTFTLPLVTQSWTLECDGIVGQATAATANQWNLLTATNGATNVTANYSMATAATASAYGAVTDQASTTTTFNIAPAWTLGGTATKMPFHIWAKIEGASASGTVLSLQLLAPTVGDLVTIYRGTACRIF